MWTTLVQMFWLMFRVVVASIQALRRLIGIMMSEEAMVTRT